MSDEKSGFNLSIGGDVSGDVAQSIDKSQHQTTNVEGDATVTNVQAGDGSDLGKLVQGLAELGIPEEEVVTLKDRIVSLKEAGEEAKGMLNPVVDAVKKYGPTVAKLAKPLLPGWAGAILDAVV